MSLKGAALVVLALGGCAAENTAPAKDRADCVDGPLMNMFPFSCSSYDAGECNGEHETGGLMKQFYNCSWCGLDATTGWCQWLPSECTKDQGSQNVYEASPNQCESTAGCDYINTKDDCPSGNDNKAECEANAGCGFYELREPGSSVSWDRCHKAAKKTCKAYNTVTQEYLLQYTKGQIGVTGASSGSGDSGADGGADGSADGSTGASGARQNHGSVLLGVALAVGALVF
jgi:hypothetical protein